MYTRSIFETGGKQYRVSVGDVLQVEKLPTEAGENFVFDKVLCVGDDESSSVKVGQPYLEGAKVVAEVKKQIRGDKIRIIKFKRRKHYKREKGHRQYLSLIKVVGIEG